MAKQTLFTARYPKAWLQEKQTIPSNCVDAIATDYEKLIKQYHEESQLVLSEDQIKKANELFTHVQDISSSWKIDTDIIQELGKITYNLYFPNGELSTSLKDDIAELFLLADSLYILTAGSFPEGCDYAISLLIYTHRHYVAGHEIPLF